MREQYPFFRDGDEQTRAVIGEEAINADLDGEYQKPYAVLTQKRLYCKNEQGNFITDASTLRSAGKGLLTGQNWFLWAVAACTGLVLILLCLWYWGLGGRWRTHELNFYTQAYINDYHALEEKIPEYEQTIKDYEEAQKEIEPLQEELKKMDYDKIIQEAEQVYEEAYRLQGILDEASNAQWTQENNIYHVKQRISDYEESLESAKKVLEQVNLEENNSLKEQISSAQSYIKYWEKEKASISEGRYKYWKVGGETYDQWGYSRYCTEKINSYKEALTKAQKDYVDVESTQAAIERYQQYIADAEITLTESQSLLDEARNAVDAAQKEVDNYQSTVDAVNTKVNRAAALEGEITQKQSALKNIPISNAQREIQRFEDSKPDYKNAQSVQRKVKLFLPCLLAFAVCVIALAVLTGMKRTKPAMTAALASACIGLICASLSNINLKNIQGFGWGYYYIMPPPLSIVLRVLPVLAVVLGILALWWNRRNTVFQIVHATGAFSFTPNVYPAEELRQFTEQVQLMQAGEANAK